MNSSLLIRKLAYGQTSGWCKITYRRGVVLSMNNSLYGNCCLTDTSAALRNLLSLRCEANLYLCTSP